MSNTVSTAAETVGVDTNKPSLALFHIGAPKTATTTLQGWLRGNRKRMANRGFGVYLPRHVRKNRFLAPFSRYYRGNQDVIDTSSFLSLFADEEHDSVILSEEALTNDFIPGFQKDRSGFEAIERTIAFLQALEIPDTRIVLTVRRQDKFLKSAYSHRVRRSGVSMSFEDWMQKEAYPTQMSWLTVTDKLDAAFGADKVSVVPFEMLEKAGEKEFYLRCIGEPLKKDFSRHTPPKEVDENSSLAEETLEIAGILNALDAKTPDEFKRRSELINHVNNFVLDNGGRSFKVDLSAITEQCCALYKAENEALAARKFPDLETSFTFPA